MDMYFLFSIHEKYAHSKLVPKYIYDKDEH